MSLPRRILFVTESFGIGGTETHLLELLRALKAEGFDVAAFCFTEPGSRAGQLVAAGIPVNTPPRFGGAPLSTARGVLALRSAIARWRPTIVHFFLPRPYLAGAPVAIAAGVPIKIMSRRSLSDYRRKWPGSAALERLLHRHMDVVLGNARAVAEELKGEGCPDTQLRLIYNGIRLPPLDKRRAEARAAIGVDGDAFVAAVIANLFPYKGHLDLIAALARISGKMPRPWTVLCAGRDEGAGTAIARTIDDNGLCDQVRLLGERTDVPVLLDAADIGVLPSTRNEGFSNAILESMARGLPMVVTDVGGNAEAVVDGVTGLVVPPNNPDALGAAILKLALDPEMRRAMGAQSRARVAEHFSFDVAVTEYCELYEELLARESAARKKA